MYVSSSISRHQLSNYYSFAPELSGLLPIIPTTCVGRRTNCNLEETSSTSDMFINSYDLVPFMSSSSHPRDLVISSLPAPNHCMAVPTYSDLREKGFHDPAGFSYKNQGLEPGGDYDQEIISSGLMETNFWPACYDHDEGLEGKKLAKVEESEVKVGRYSVEERKGRILRYLKKRNKRNFNKTIKYACRKTLADKRVRVRGRFAKNNDPSSEDENVMMKTNTTDHSFGQNVSFYDDDYSLQMISYDDDLLQAAMAGLVYLPYLAAG